jgi:hypothetical protein
LRALARASACLRALVLRLSRTAFFACLDFERRAEVAEEGAADDVVDVDGVVLVAEADGFASDLGAERERDGLPLGRGTWEDADRRLDIFGRHNELGPFEDGAPAAVRGKGPYR